MVREGTFVRIESWMVNRLGLKGPELVAFALINGVCSASGDATGEYSWSHFSIQYVADWCGISKRSAQDVLDRLVDMGVIEKGPRDSSRLATYRPTSRHGVEGEYAGPCDECAFRQPREGRDMADSATHVANTAIADSATHIADSATHIADSATHIADSATHIADSATNTDSDTDRVKDPKDTLSGKRRPRYDEGELEAARRVVEHLNSVTGSRFRATSEATLRHVVARLREGMTEAELMSVVDVKAAEWGGRPEMAGYLRPETLFGPKCEGYLQAAGRRCRSAGRELPGWAVAMQAGMPVIGGQR